MTPLETRLRSLRQAGGGVAPSADELRRRSAVRSRRRLFTAAAVAVPFVAIALAVFVAAKEPDHMVDREEPGREDPDRFGLGGGSVVPGPVRHHAWHPSLGDVTGVQVTVSPSTDLHDGDLLEVRIDGLERLPGAEFFLCAGDVVAEDAMTACTTAAVERAWRDPTTPVTAGEGQIISVSRVIHITRGSGDPNTSRPYDCATEAAGCVLAVGRYEQPVRAVLLPLTFVDDPAPVATASIRPSTGLTELQQVTLAAEGLPPNGAFIVRPCAAAPSDRCDGIEWPAVRANERGSLATTISIRTTLYDDAGRINCVTSSCAVVISDGDGRVAEVPFRFAPGVQATVAELRLDPSGPYVDRQMVTVHGTGFPPGFDLGGHLGQCPANKDTAVEERCVYQVITPIIVDAYGTFTVTQPLTDTLPFTGTCVTGPGCVLAWVVNHGPIAASVPLDFSP